MSKWKNQGYANPLGLIFLAGCKALFSCSLLNGLGLTVWIRKPLGWGVGLGDISNLPQDVMLASTLHSGIPIITYFYLVEVVVQEVLWRGPEFLDRSKCGLLLCRSPASSSSDKCWGLESDRLGPNPGAATHWCDVARGGPGYLGPETECLCPLSLIPPQQCGSTMGLLNSKPASLYWSWN